MLSAAAAAAAHGCRKYNHDRLAPDSLLPEGQLHWTATTTLLYPMICSSAGLVAGLFGIGGGESVMVYS
jgi:uncharacterized membrane protein YfcA